MSDEKKEVIKLKQGAIPPLIKEVDGKEKKTYPKAIEISIANQTLKIAKGEKVQVPLSELQQWLNTDKFDWLKDESEDDESEDDESEDDESEDDESEDDEEIIPEDNGGN